MELLELGGTLQLGEGLEAEKLDCGFFAEDVRTGTGTGGGGEVGAAEEG